MPASPLPLWRALALALLLSACGSAAPVHLTSQPARLGAVRLAEASATSTTTAPPPPPPTTTTAPWVSHPERERAARVTVAAPATSGGWPVKVLTASSCMDNGPHSAELAHACWDGLINRYPWPTSTMFSVMMCESHGNPWDTGVQTRWGRAVGLMQDMGGPYDPEANMAVAYHKYQDSGLDPWVSSRSCWG